MTARQILFCPHPANDPNQTMNQANLRPYGTSKLDGGVVYVIDWFGGMADFDPLTGVATKILPPPPTPGPRNYCRYDGNKIVSQPNFDFVNGVAVGAQAPGFWYACQDLSL